MLQLRKELLHDLASILKNSVTICVDLLHFFLTCNSISFILIVLLFFFLVFCTSK